MTIDWVLTDPLDAAAIRDLLRAARFGRRLEVHRRLASTGDRVRELAAAGAEEGLAVIADEQTQGRGRRGNAWLSPAGAGIWMTVLVEVGGAAPGTVTLGAGVAARRALERGAGVAPGLKWPNDLEAAGAKLGGILAETVGPAAAGGMRVALGIGINVHAAPAGLGRAATALDALAGRPLARNPLAAALLDELEVLLDALRAGRAAQVLAAWREACNHLGAEVEVTGAGGAPEPPLRGVALDVDERGALLLRRPDGRVEAVLAGSLRVVAPAPARP
jgi:BirA family biotin operon repressor/biotin-[acetyl-CoA-carboxylase] ligase